MRNKLPESFEDLLKNKYGALLHMQPGTEEQADDLLAGYYGNAPRAKGRGQGRGHGQDQGQDHGQKGRHENGGGKQKKIAALGMSLGHDDGETLPQANREHPFEEYVVEGVELVWENSQSVLTEAAPYPDRSVQAEYGIDLFRPMQPETSAAPSAPAAPASQAVKGAAPAPASRPSDPSPASTANPPAIPSAIPSASPSAPSGSSDPAAEATTTEADFLADMQRIFTGKAAYDPESKTTVAKDRSAPSAPPPTAPSRASAPPASNPSDAIFERIAQSMQYANAYDIGTVELENRFADFDKTAELRKKADADKKARSAAPSVSQSQSHHNTGSSEFIEDLDAIRRQKAPVILGTVSPNLSRPFYDTGEHVLTGGNYYPDQLRVGANPGVAFSYGQIISMADLFENVDQMMSADAGQLARLKQLIERSTAYYAGNKANPALDVGDGEWDKVTGGRYLQLAEMNFEHFSPNFLYRNAAFAKSANRYGNNKSAWEAYHTRAIREAQAVGLAPASPNSSPLLPLEIPLITNAFGDHFLTDAFAAGHLINKEAIAEYWKATFFQGGKLRPAAEGFFSRLAAKAFTLGTVKEKFSNLETVEWKGIIFRPNINSPSRFASVLSAIAEEQPDRISNMVVKAIHDRFNKDGVEVYNNAGHKPWLLTGDGSLNAENKGIMQQAVAQSIANINDPSIMVSNLDLPPMLEKVWRYTPQLTAASQQKVQGIIAQYMDPTGNLLVDAAADIISRKVDLLISELIKAHALKPA